MPRYDDNGNLIPDKVVRYDDNGNVIPDVVRYDDNGNVIPPSFPEITVKDYNYNTVPSQRKLPRNWYTPPKEQILDPVQDNLTMWDAMPSGIAPYASNADPIKTYNFNAGNLVAEPIRRSTRQDLTSMAIRTAPGLIGNWAGGTVGSIVPGAGTLAGVAVGGGVGSAIGEGLGQVYDWWTDPNFKGFNPTQMVVQGGIGAVPFSGKSPVLAKNAGKAALAKYAAETAVKSGIEGGFTNALATYPTAWAEGYNPSLVEVGQNALTGTAFGSTLGLGMGSVPSVRYARGKYQHNLPSAPTGPTGAHTIDPFAGRDWSVPVEPPQPPLTGGSKTLKFGEDLPVEELQNVLPFDGRDPSPKLPPQPTFYTPEERAARAAKVESRWKTPEHNISLGMETGKGPKFGEVNRGVEPLEHYQPNLPIDLPEKLPLEPLSVQPPKSDSGFPPLKIAPEDLKAAKSNQELTVQPPKPRVRKTAEGDIINPETGEVLNVEPPKRTNVTYSETPMEMRVTRYKEGNTGLHNVAMGGANRRTLDVLGSSLYSRERPITTIKELLQNAFDEHKELGIDEPVRVLIDHEAPNPITEGGEKGRSITVRDRGRGLTTDQIYSVLTNIGETGKAGVESASGGFGFAKAAPMLGGKHVKITSVVDTPKGRMRYTFEGTPEQLKPAEVPEETRGVALNTEKVGKEVPTGIEVTTFYDKNIPGFYKTVDWAKNMTERSPSAKGGIKLATSYEADPNQARRWLDETKENPIKPEEYNYIARHASSDHKSQPMPTLMDSFNTPGAKVNIHYDVTPGTESSGVDVHMMNKGMYQGTTDLSYGESTPNVPKSIVADIIATVEEGTEHYPFSANREQLNDTVTNSINKWVRDNIITGVMKKRVAEIQRKYDNIDLLHPETDETGLHYLDDGNILTPKDHKQIFEHPKMVEGLSALEEVHKKILEVADSLGWRPETYSSATWKYPSERLKKFGILIQAPEESGVTLGIHIPRPDDSNSSSILINLLEHLAKVQNHQAPIDQLESDLLTTLTHEIAHIPGGGHDKNFAYRDAELRGKLGAINTTEWFNTLGGAFNDGTGRIDPAISDLLSIYDRAKGNAKGGANPLIATGINIKGPSDYSSGAKGNAGRSGKGSVGSKDSTTVKWGKPSDETGSVFFRKRNKGPKIVGPAAETTPVKITNPFEKPKDAPPLKAPASRPVYSKNNKPWDEKTFAEKVKHVARKTSTVGHGLVATGDLGPILRQGKNLGFRPIWWKALGQQFKSYATEGGHQKFVEKIMEHPLMQPKGKYGKHEDGTNKSYIDFAGVHVDTRSNKVDAEDAAIGLDMVENLVDKLGGKYTINPARASNRAYADTISQLRIGLTEILYNNHKKIYDSMKKTAKTSAELAHAEKWNPDNQELARKIGREVNQTTGRADLGSFEAAADTINLAAFSARNFKSNIDQITKMLSMPYRLRSKGPEKVMAQEHFKQLLSFAALTTTLAMSHKLLGGEPDIDPQSSSFGKSRFGRNITADFTGGQGKFVRFGSALKTAAIRNKKGKLINLADVKNEVVNGNVMDRFEDLIENQASPVAALAMALINRREKFRPLNLTSLNPAENTITRTMTNPISWQNFYEIAKEDPAYLPLMGYDLLGGGINVESTK